MGANKVLYYQHIDRNSSPEGKIDRLAHELFFVDTFWHKKIRLFGHWDPENSNFSVKHNILSQPTQYGGSKVLYYQNIDGNS